MFSTTPQERMALGVTALLIAAGTGVRLVGSDPPPSEWTAPADTQSDARVSQLRMEVGRETAERRRAAEPLSPGEKIDPNRATAVELERLPRVGPALAARIVAHRQENGPFRSLADLDAVAGIGPAMLTSIAPHVALPASAPTRGAPARAARADALVDVNRASAEELQALPGVGPVLARRIVEWRSTHGPFGSIEALEQVPGIGPSLRARIAPRVRVDP